MKIRLLTFALAIGCFVVLAGGAPAGNADTPDLKPFGEEMRQLVEKYYPKVEVKFKDASIHFEFNTRTFMIHEPRRNGEWQDAQPEIGPQKGGIRGEIALIKGEYFGQAAVPQAFDKRYFVVLLMAPYSKKLDYHLYVQLSYPPEAPKEFVEEFERLVNGFESYIPQEGE